VEVEMVIRSRWFVALTLAWLALAGGPTGCSGSTLTAPSSVTDGGTGPGTTDDGGTTVEPDGGTNPGADAAVPPTYNDGTPTRVACTSALGMGLTPNTHGRLDGVLVSIVAANERACPADPAHLHLQVKSNGAVYDIAVNLDGFEGETDAPLPGIPFAEGWHAQTDLDYVRDFGLHSTALTLTTPTSIRQRLESVLANANHVAIFATSYTGSDGAHLVHRQSGLRDGAIVVNPLAAKAHVIAFRFVSDTF
jgi:hypothetical protein